MKRLRDVLSKSYTLNEYLTHQNNFSSCINGISPIKRDSKNEDLIVN